MADMTRTTFSNAETKRQFVRVRTDPYFLSDVKLQTPLPDVEVTCACQSRPHSCVLLLPACSVGRKVVLTQAIFNVTPPSFSNSSTYLVFHIAYYAKEYYVNVFIIIILIIVIISIIVVVVVVVVAVVVVVVVVVFVFVLVFVFVFVVVAVVATTAVVVEWLIAR